MRPIRTIAVFPTLLTLGNLICGFFAIVVASRIIKPESAAHLKLMVDNVADLNNILGNDARNLIISGSLIFLAMVFDGLDGYVARLARTSSDFGAELDSLCDVVSFGVAPGFLLVKMCPDFTLAHNKMVWIVAAAYAACAALRLARFNVETSDDDEHLHFSGLPSPAAAAVIASFAILFGSLRENGAAINNCLQTALPFLGLAVALLMVSRIRYPHVTNRILRGHRSFGHVVAVLFFFVALMVAPGYTMPAAATSFALYGPVRFAWDFWVKRRRRDEPIF
jgi:CDP-diacylglycerol---serine O-phosphatidyltransferase